MDASVGEEGQGLAQDLGGEAPTAELRRNGVADVSVVVQQVLGEPVTYRGTSDNGRFCRQIGAFMLWPDTALIRRVELERRREDGCSQRSESGWRLPEIPQIVGDLSSHPPTSRTLR